MTPLAFHSTPPSTRKEDGNGHSKQHMYAHSDAKAAKNVELKWQAGGGGQDRKEKSKKEGEQKTATRKGQGD